MAGIEKRVEFLDLKVREAWKVSSNFKGWESMYYPISDSGMFPNLESRGQLNQT